MRITRWVVLIALFIIPLIPIIPGIAIANSLFFPFITGKNFAFRVLVEIAFAGWVVLAVADKRYRPQFSWTFALLGLLVVWMAIADTFAVNPEKAFWSNFERMDGWVTLIHLLMLFLATSVLTADKLWRRWWFAFVGAATLVCLYGIGQFLCAGHACGGPGMMFAIHQGSSRVDASFGNSAYLAAYMLFAFALTLWLAFETDAKRKWLRYILYVLAAVDVFILFATETRGAILGFIGAVVLGGIIWVIWSGSKTQKYAAGALVAVIIVLSGIFVAIHKEPWVQQLPAFGRLASISLSDSETTTRFHIWNMAYQGFLERPVTGWGQEGFNYVFNKFYNPVLYAQEAWFDRAHDVFLDWLIAGGAPALILFIALLIAAVVALFRSNVSRTERMLLISVLAAYAFQGIFVFDNLFTYVPLIMILAMAHAASSRPIRQMESWGEVPEDQLGMLPIPVAGVLLVLVLWFVNVPNVRAAVDIIGGLEPSSDVNQNLDAFKQAFADGSFANQEITEQLLSFTNGVVADQNVSTADKQTVATYALQQGQALADKIPQDARIRLEYALTLGTVGDYADALKQIKVAEQLSPKKQSIYIEEGALEWQSGNVAAANAAFQKAYSFDNSFADLAAYAAAGHIGTGNIAAGKALLVQRFGTTTVDSQILLLAYYTIKDYPDFIAIWRQRVIDENGAADAEFGLAAALANAGQYAAARAEVQQAIKDHPEDASQGAAYLQQINSLAGSSSK